MNSHPVILLTILLTAAIISVPTSQAALPGVGALSELIIGEFDTNADGIIDSGEWQGGIERGFDELDQNGDSSLTGDEIDGLTGLIGRQIGETTAKLVVVIIRKVVMTLDIDKDNRVSRDEYGEKSRDMLGKIDADTDGNVTRAELDELPARLLGL